MTIHRNSIAIINVILLAFVFWLSWMGDSHLPGQLNPQMSSDVMFQKYQNVCANLTVSLTVMAVLVMLLINVVLIGPRLMKWDISA